MELGKGKKLNNKYEILKVLKAGGFGITYEAVDIELERKVVIKEYYPSSIVNRDGTDTVMPFRTHVKVYEKGLEDFLDEAKALAKFDTNPNIVNIIEHFKANGTAYFVMPFEEGEDLSQYLDKHGKMSEEEILNIIFPLLNALQEIHKIGMVHRDIKPANIFMRTNKSPLLIDFGNARYAFGKNSQSLADVCTRGYAPVEQSDSKSVQGAYTDIYALGATIYTMATYSVPPESTSRSLAKLKNLADPLKPITSSNFSLEFKNAVHKSLNIMEKDRYQSVDEFRKALNGISDGGDKRKNNENRNRLLLMFSIFLFVGGLFLANELREPIPVEPNATGEENITIERNASGSEELTSDEIVTIDGLMYQNQRFTQQDKENYDNDKEGGRVWTWDGAKNYCDNLTLGGKSDWRLPTREELMKLGSVKLYHSDGDYKNYDEWKALHLEKWNKWFENNKDKRIKNSKGYEYFIRQEFVENMPPLNGKYKGVEFWSITEYNNNSSDAWDVNFYDGSDSRDSKSSELYALCVRRQ